MQEFLPTLLRCSISMSLVTISYVALQPFLSKRYSAKWHYMIWLFISAGWIFPYRPRIDFLFSVQIPNILTFVQSITGSKSSMGAGDMATFPLWGILTAIWGLGVGSAVLYHALRHFRFKKMVHRWSEPVTDLKILGVLDTLCLELGIKKQIKLSKCESVTSPMLVGFYRPTILLPSFNFSDDKLSLILKHELIHFKRHDLWFKAMILMTTVLHWFNPVVYLMARAAALQCEISCDALVLENADIKQRKQYGEIIIAGVRNGSKLQTSILTKFYGGKKGMKNRISSIMDIKQKRAGVLILCLVLVGILLTGMLTSTAIGDASQDSINKEYVTWSNNNENNSDQEITRLKELLRQLYYND